MSNTTMLLNMADGVRFSGFAASMEVRGEGEEGGEDRTGRRRHSGVCRAAVCERH